MYCWTLIFPNRWKAAARRFDPLCGAWCCCRGRLPGDLGVQRAAGHRLHPDCLPGSTEQESQVQLFGFFGWKHLLGSKQAVLMFYFLLFVALLHGNCFSSSSYRFWTVSSCNVEETHWPLKSVNADPSILGMCQPVCHRTNTDRRQPFALAFLHSHLWAI